MSILTKEEILKEIKKGNIKINPFNKNNVGPGSIDLTLDDKFRTFKKSRKVYNVDEKIDYKKLTKFSKKKSIIIKPNETILAITKEKISLAENICGWLEGRSRFARLGLMVHISASFLQPGISNYQVLEMNNMGKVPLRLNSGIKICQIIFEKTDGKARYKGIFRNQTEP
ncbi:MAG: dCTP deaminase [Candidatus Nanoarchaeia archaeon]|nr:dCTP deaminase [Candidatus Nanoarchaeia archaeon]